MELFNINIDFNKKIQIYTENMSSITDVSCLSPCYIFTSLFFFFARLAQPSQIHLVRTISYSLLQSPYYIYEYQETKNRIIFLIYMEWIMKMKMIRWTLYYASINIYYIFSNKKLADFTYKNKYVQQWNIGYPHTQNRVHTQIGYYLIYPYSNSKTNKFENRYDRIRIWMRIQFCISMDSI